MNFVYRTRDVNQRLVKMSDRILREKRLFVIKWRKTKITFILLILSAIVMSSLRSTNTILEPNASMKNKGEAL